MGINKRHNIRIFFILLGMSVCVVLFENCGSYVPEELLDECEGSGCSYLSSASSSGGSGSSFGDSSFGDSSFGSSSSGSGSSFGDSSSGSSSSGSGSSFGDSSSGSGERSGYENNYGQQDYHQYQIDSHTQNFNVHDHFGHSLKARYTIIVGVDVNLGSESTGVAAFATGDLPRGSEVNIVNLGTISGKGGQGGAAYTSSNLKKPGDGGVAIETSVPLTINNYGRIYGGGGGGTGGLAVSQGSSSCTTGGHGGSGGAGYPGGAGGGAILDNCGDQNNFTSRTSGVSGTNSSGGGTAQWVEETCGYRDDQSSCYSPGNPGGNLGQKGSGSYGGLPGAAVNGNGNGVNFSLRGTVLGPEIEIGRWSSSSGE